MRGILRSVHKLRLKMSSTSNGQKIPEVGDNLFFDHLRRNLYGMRKRDFAIGRLIRAVIRDGKKDHHFARVVACRVL